MANQKVQAEKIWQNAYAEAYKTEYAAEYSKLFSEEYENLVNGGYDKDDARHAAHSNIIDAVKDNADRNAKDIADAVVTMY